MAESCPEIQIPIRRRTRFLSSRLRPKRGQLGPQEEIHEEQESRTLSEYLFPSETLGQQCEKPADALSPNEAQLADAYIHEISNQVTVILGSSQLALEAVRGNLTIRKQIEEIVEAARRAARATHKLLELKVKDLSQNRCYVSRRDEETTILP